MRTWLANLLEDWSNRIRPEQPFVPWEEATLLQRKANYIQYLLLNKMSPLVEDTATPEYKPEVDKK